MKALLRTNVKPGDLIDTRYGSERSIVLRYMGALDFGLPDKEDADYRSWIRKTSLREGARIFELLRYKGVGIYLMDETSLMFTKTLKSIDGCISIAACKLKGYEPVVFESGGNTGMALSSYGQEMGVETFFFCPEENLQLLKSSVFTRQKAHLISVARPGAVKGAARLFEEKSGFKHIPEKGWRQTASMFRGLFILEHMMAGMTFEWLAQTVSAAFGPLGIYSVLKGFIRETGCLPRLLGIQQEVNSPLYRYWKTNRYPENPSELSSTANLLTRIMYDVTPQTYGTFEDLKNLLTETGGDLTTINHEEFFRFLERDFDGNTTVNKLGEKGVPISRNNNGIIDKTGMIALAGTFKEIDKGTITEGSRVLCCLTSGASDADGQAVPEYRIDCENSLDSLIEEYSRRVLGR